MSRGKYTVLEGCHGTGVTTQAELLATWLGGEITDGCGDGTFAREIRAMNEDFTLPTINPMTDVLLYASARAETLETTIKPKLAQGYQVIGDRSWVSELAYQKVPKTLDRNIRMANKLALGPYIVPDLLIVLDADPRACHTRLTRETSLYRQADIKFDTKVRKRYLKAARDMGGFVIDAMPPAEEVQDTIRQRVQKELRL